MALVAATGLLLSGVHAGVNPGFYWSCRGWEAGACRNDRAGTGVDNYGHSTGPLYQAGLWREGSTLVTAGAWSRFDSIYARAGGPVTLIW